MDDQAPNYRREFLSSPHHAALGLLTLGVGFLSASLLGLIAGGTLYTLGWLHLPDVPFFRRWVDRRHDAARRAAEEQKVAEFVRRRDALLDSLSASRRERYSFTGAVQAPLVILPGGPMRWYDPASDTWWTRRILGDGPCDHAPPPCR